jgi:hypothetical protein
VARLLRGTWCAWSTCVHAPVGLLLDDCVRCVDRLIPSREKRACIDLKLGCKHACLIFGTRVE